MKLVLDNGTEIELDKVEVVELRPGDRLLIGIHKALDDLELESVVEALAHAFGEDRVLLYHGVNAEIKVVREPHVGS